jgi:hypothetical protein
LCYSQKVYLEPKWLRYQVQCLVIIQPTATQKSSKIRKYENPTILPPEPKDFGFYEKPTVQKKKVFEFRVYPIILPPEPKDFDFPKTSGTPEPKDFGFPKTLGTPEPKDFHDMEPRNPKLACTLTATSNGKFFYDKQLQKISNTKPVPVNTRRFLDHKQSSSRSVKRF